MNIRFFLWVAFAAIHLSACSDKGEVPAAGLPFADTPTTQKVNPQFPEVSGIAPSFTSAKSLWFMQDGGNKVQVSLVDETGHLSRNVFLKGITNRDWEDMIIMRDPSKDFAEIYLADIGNNNLAAQQPIIYRFREPQQGVDTVTDISFIRFMYPDGQHDAEAFLVDPSTMDLFIITKRDARSRIYRIAYPYPANAEAAFVGELDYNTVVSATANQAGAEILVKTYQAIYYYKREPGETFVQALLRKPVSLGYRPELQGESICFAADNKGFYTVPEMPLAGDQLLSFYKRK